MARTVDADVDGAKAGIAAIAAAGVDLDAVTNQLELDGVKSFSASFDSLLGDDSGAARPDRFSRGCVSLAERALENPLRAGLRVGGATVPAAFVIFGATGDLAQRKLLPAIYNLGRRGLLPARFALVGYARTEMTDDQYRNFCRAAIESHSRTPIDEHYWPAFAAMLRYHAGGFDDDAEFHALGETLERVDAEHGTEGNRVYYLSTPAKFFPVIVQRMGAAKLNRPPGFARVVIEKPFGHDLASSRELAAIVHSRFASSRSTGSTTTWARRPFRTSSRSGSPTRSSSRCGTDTYVDHVQITVAEAIGVEHRAAFYEDTGVLRDIVQNHLLQVLALVAMEPPVDVRGRSRPRREDQAAAGGRADERSRTRSAVSTRPASSPAARSTATPQEPDVPADSTT